METFLKYETCTTQEYPYKELTLYLGPESLIPTRELLLCVLLVLVHKI